MCSLALAVASLASFGAHAAPSPESIATKTFLARQKAAQNAYRGALKAAEQQLGIELKAVETGLKTSPNLFAAGNATFAALRDFQGAVQTAGVDAIQEQADAAKDALASIGGGPLEGHFPEVFYLSDGGSAAQFQESLTSDLAKAHVRVRKRVGRIRGLFGQEDFGFSFRIRAPRPIEQLTWNEGFVSGTQSFPPTIDLIVAWGSAGTDDDSQIRAAGAAFEGPVDVAIDNGIDGFLAPDLVVFDERFTTEFDGNGFAEGSWLVTTGTAGSSELAIGIP
jgi:hypothetical protein